MPKDSVVPDLETADTGAFFLILQILLEDSPAVAIGMAQCVQLQIDTVIENTTFIQDGRWIIYDLRLYSFAHPVDSNPTLFTGQATVFPPRR